MDGLALPIIADRSQTLLIVVYAFTNLYSLSDVGIPGCKVSTLYALLYEVS